MPNGIGVLKLVANRSSLLGVNVDRDRAIIDELDIHHCTEHAVFDSISLICSPDPLHKLLILIFCLRVNQLCLSLSESHHHEVEWLPTSSTNDHLLCKNQLAFLQSFAVTVANRLHSTSLGRCLNETSRYNYNLLRSPFAKLMSDRLTVSGDIARLKSSLFPFSCTSVQQTQKSSSLFEECTHGVGHALCVPRCMHTNGEKGGVGMSLTEQHIITVTDIYAARTLPKRVNCETRSSS